MEPNVKRSKIIRRCLEMKTKWFCAWVPCADYSREGKKERERERQTEKHHQQRVPNMEIKRYVCMNNA